MSQASVGAKGQVNEVIRGTLRRFPDDEPIAFFCECRRRMRRVSS